MQEQARVQAKFLQEVNIRHKIPSTRQPQALAMLRVQQTLRTLRERFSPLRYFG